MRNLLRCLVLLLFAPGIILAAGTGKIRGKVVDKSSKEPLIGATVSILETSLGAPTDVEGNYVILNVPTGTYSVRASYVGYQAITITEARVNSDLTTEMNFELPGEGVTVPTVEIRAERPLVNKSATNAVRIIDQEFFSKLPQRGVNAAIALQPGVVVQQGNVYIRGGRPDETGFQLEGVAIGNVLFGGRGVSFTAEAVEQIQVQAGGYGAELGGANAGIVTSQLRTGNAEHWKASLLAETDNFTGQGKRSLGTYSYGYSDYTATLGGPISGKTLRFFGSLQNTFFRDPDLRAWSGVNFTGANALITDAAQTSLHPTTTSADTLNVAYAAGNRLAGSSNRNAFSGTLLLDLGEISVRGAGSYSMQKSRDAVGLLNIFNQARTPERINDDGLANLKFSHVLSDKSFYEVNLNYYTNTAIIRDPDFQDKVDLYGDSTANANLGYKFKEEGQPWPSWSIFGGAPSGMSLNQPGAPIAGYDKALQNGIGGRADLTSQQDKHEFRVGGEYTRYTIRRFNPSTITRAGVIRDYPVTNDSSRIVLETLLRNTGGGIDNYGFDVYGKEIDNDLTLQGNVTDYGPRHPVVAAAYVIDKIEFSDLNLKIGLRYDYINPDSKEYKNPGNIASVDSLGGLVATSNIIPTPTTSQISPRIGVSFPVTDRTVFHAQFGKYIQQSRMRDSYLGIGRTSNIINGGFFVQNTSGAGLKPERTTQYEMGFQQQVSDRASFDITAFYKDIVDQVQYTQILPTAGATNPSYAALINGDFSTSQGLELSLTLRRTNRIQAQMNYSFSDARSTGSNPTALAGAVVASGAAGYIPHYVFPPEFNQAHRGSMLLDYRFAKDDGGSILEELGMNVLAAFNSGHSFTRLRIDDANVTDPRNRTPVEEIGASTTPWFFQLDARLDKTVRFGSFDANIYVYVQNILGTDNAVDVFPRTGDPKDDGWLSIANGRAKVDTYGQPYVDAYRAFYLGQNAANFGPPRQIRFGIKLEY